MLQHTLEPQESVVDRSPREKHLPPVFKKKLFIPCMDYYIYLSHPNKDDGYIVCKSWYVSRSFYQLFFLLSCFPPGMV